MMKPADLMMQSLKLPMQAGGSSGVKLDQGYGRSATERAAALKEASEAFETIFLHQMMKASREASMQYDLLGSNGIEQSRAMLDEERAEALANSSSLGIAEAIYNQFAAHAGVPRIK